MSVCLNRQPAGAGLFFKEATLMSDHPLEEILHPKSIAVVGASASGRGAGFLAPLREFGFKGELYPVNPKYDEIFGLKSYARLRDIPGPVDYVISSIPAAGVLDLIDDCVEKQVKCVHLFTARFSETGRQDAAELEQEILRRAQDGGIRLIGPNCLGVYYPKMGMAFNEGMPKKPGNVALASQSGGGVGEITADAGLRGIRFSKAISYGNALDFNESDFLEYFTQDPETEIILMYIEGLRDPRRFHRVLREAAAVKPVIILKGGRGSAGTRATASHTASMAGTQKLWDSMIKQAGAISAVDTEEIVDIALSFCFSTPITGRRTAVAGGSGGSSVWAADLCEEAGLDVIPLPLEIREELKNRGNQVWDWIGNPADFSISMGDRRDTADIMKMMAAHPDFDLLLMFMSGPWRGGRPGNVSIEEHMKQYELREIAGKPMIVILQERPMGPPVKDTKQLADMMAQMRKWMIKAKLPVYPSIKRAANAAVKVIEYYERRPA
jgi:acyl-CoA synthetase (NDP forming)